MPRNILLSFLGTTDYVECNYYLEKAEAQEAKEIKYSQEAIVQLLCQHYGPGDAIYIFLTDEARAKNWVDNGHTDFKTKEVLSNVGLEKRLKKLGVRAQIVDLPIEEGVDSDEIWSVFQTVFSCIQPEDRITLDITHSFRSLPTFATTLLSYARTIRKASISGIYYGAFEYLGPQYEVKTKPMKDRNVPLLDLTAFSRLQEWSVASRDFIEYGNATTLATQAAESSRENPSQLQSALEDFAEELKRLSLSISTVRGQELVDGKIFQDLNDSIQRLQQQPLPAAFQPLFEKVQDKLLRFKPTTDQENGLAAVRWCLDHKLVQQGITLLLEVSLNFIFEAVNHIGITMDPNNYQDREFLGKAVKVLGKYSENQWKKPLSDRPEIVKQVQALPIVQQLAKPIQDLSRIRNDINHGGFTENNPPEQFRTLLENKFTIIKSIINRNPLPHAP
jgi:CRISPR-associated Csx2 family protein